MAVDQARHLNFFREMLSTSNNYSNNNMTSIHHQIGNNLINMYSNTSNSLPMNNNDSLLLPFYNLNDVVFNSGVGIGKLPPPVKDDSGVTFNNSLVPPSASRKRQREPTVMPLAIVSGAGVGLPSLLTSNATSGIVSKESNAFSFLGEDLSLEIMQQQLELDRLVSDHMEKMRIEIEERKKQQLRRIMAAFGDAMAKKMREKEEEIEKIVKTTWELEERVKTLCLQNQIWRELAQTNEATANALRSNLEQVLQQARENDTVRTAGELTDDAVSCCGSSGQVDEREAEEERESRKQMKINDDAGGEKWVYRGKKVGSYCGEGKRMCKKCGEGESTVLVLPCKHLCLCTSCGPAVNACPICHSSKTASVHINLS